MGGRGGSSMSARQGGGLASLQDRLVTDGHVSLDVSDYAGVPGSDVRKLLASQDYETAAYFNDRDELIFIRSNFDPSHVSYKVKDLKEVVEATPGNITNFHNHPVDRYTIQMFSPADVFSYVDSATGGKLTEERLSTAYRRNVTYKSGLDRVTAYSVHTQTGSEYTLTYTGVKTNPRTKTKNFASAYSKAFNTRMRYCNDAESVSQDMIEWTKKNAPKYGFEFSRVNHVPFKQ